MIIKIISTIFLDLTSCVATLNKDEMTTGTDDRHDIIYILSLIYQTIMSIPDKIPQVSPETSNTLMLLTDPYHDYNLKAAGYPDGSAIMSAVQRRYDRYTLANPFALTAGQTWSFHIYATPLHFRDNFSAASSQGNTITVTTGGDVMIGPLNIAYFKYDVGGAMIESKVVALGADNPYKNTNEAQIRTVSFGYELHNTTAEIQRAGSVTVYRAPSNYHEVHMYMKEGAIVQPFSATFINQMPHSLGIATNYPNTRTWEAAKGVYSVCLPHPTNTFSPSLPSNFILQGGGLANSVVCAYNSSYTTTKASITHSPLSCTGVFSSRYSAEQTFTLDFRQILEILPGPSDTMDLSFASTCPQLDSTCIKMYKRMYTQIPPGVPVSFNAAGDWVRSIIRIAKNVLPTLSAFPGPVGKIAGIANMVAHSIPVPDTHNRTVTNSQLKRKLSISKPKIQKAVKTILLKRAPKPKQKSKSKR